MIENQQIDLTPFCVQPSKVWLALNRPWTRDGYTWASNGPILVRVPEIAGVLDNEHAPASEPLLRHWPKQPPAMYRIAHLPPPNLVPCGCGDPKCSFAPLGVTNSPFVGDQIIAIGIRTFSRGYLAKVMTLPGLLVAAREGGPATPMFFRFDGGDGLFASVIDTSGAFDPSQQHLQFAEIEEVTK